MRKVRKDVVEKLISGLNEKRVNAVLTGGSVPKRFQYDTRKATHCIYFDGIAYYCNSILYDGTRCHTTIEI